MAMKICIVVCNSVWHDPRVLKQIEVYRQQPDVQLCCVGMTCERYDREKVEQLGLPVSLMNRPADYRKKLRSVTAKLRRELGQHWEMKKLIEACEPDIIHANDLDGFIPAMLARKKTGAKVIYDSHEVYVENDFMKRKPAYRKALKYIEGKLVRRCELMISVSHAAARYFEKEYHIPRPMVITNCVSRVAQPSAAEKHRGFEVLNHGKFYPRRGFELMIPACELLKAYPEIRMAARGFGMLEAQMKQSASLLENPEQFVLYPPVTVQELIPMAAKAHVGVAITEPQCLNFELSVSNRLFEYAAAGLPVIMSDIPEHRFLNEKYNFGIILSENTPEAFAEAVIRLYTDPALYAMLAANAGKLSDEVNWENEFDKLLQAERQMMRSKAARGSNGV